MIASSHPERVLINYQEPNPDALIKIGVAVVADNFEVVGQKYNPRRPDGRWQATRLIVETIGGGNFFVQSPDYRTLSPASMLASALDVRSSIATRRPIVESVRPDFSPIVLGRPWDGISTTKLVSKLLVVSPDSNRVIEPGIEPDEEYDVTDQLIRHQLLEIFGKSPEGLINQSRYIGNLATAEVTSLES